MELKLKDNSPGEETAKTLFEKNENTLGAEFNPFADVEPVRIKTTIEQVPVAKKEVDVIGIVKWVVIIAIVVGGIKLVSNLLNPKVEDITQFVNADKDYVEEQLDVELVDNAEVAKKIPHYSDGNITVDGNDKLGIVYIDGVRKGIHIYDKKYSMFGVTLGDPEYKLEELVSFEYDEYFNVLNDMAKGKSTAYFYFNSKNNDCLVVTINDNSARVVALTYFNDYKLISKNLSGLD